MPLIFQYGSNCTAARLNGPTRLNENAKDLGKVQTVDEYRIAFNVWSQTNGCAAADLVGADGSGHHAWGVLYEVREDFIRGRRGDGQKTLAQIEGPRYEETTIRVRNEAGEQCEAITFRVKPAERCTGLWTSAVYVGHIVNGLRDHDVLEDYVQGIIDIAFDTNQRAAGRATEDFRLIESLRNT